MSWGLPTTPRTPTITCRSDPPGARTTNVLRLGFSTLAQLCNSTNQIFMDYSRQSTPTPIWGWGCSGDCDSWVFDCRPLTSRHNRRVNSRNPKTEARELGKLKNPPIVGVWRHYDKPIPKWKADLHAFALSFLPAVVAFHAALAASGAIGPTFCIGLVLYAFTFGTVGFIKGFSKEVDDKAARNKVGISLLLVLLQTGIPDN